MIGSTQPKISVVIITYEFEKFIAECIESVLAQTLRPFEIIITDDNSTDNSWEIISEYARKHPEIRAYRHERNIGVPRNMNYAKSKVRGDLISWIDGDDGWLSRKLDLEWKALQENPEAKIAYSNVNSIDESGNFIMTWYDGKGSPLPSGDVFIEVFSKRFFPNLNSVFRNFLMYNSLLDESHFDLNIESYWDWDEKIRLTANNAVVYTGEILVEHRAHEGGISRDRNINYPKVLRQVYEKNLPLLEGRTEAEKAQVKCRIESLIAIRQISYPQPDRNANYSAENVFIRNISLLRKLPKRERASLLKKISPLMAELAELMTKDALERGDKKSALKLWLQSLRYDLKRFDPYLAAQVLLPRSVYSALRMVKNIIRRPVQ
jgi:glycosyltransferase involved in cell wall biosynthesis